MPCACATNLLLHPMGLHGWGCPLNLLLAGWREGAHVCCLCTLSCFGLGLVASACGVCGSELQNTVKLHRVDCWLPVRAVDMVSAVGIGCVSHGACVLS